MTTTLTNDNYLHNLCPKCNDGHTYFYNESTKLIEFNKCTPIISKVLSNGADLGNNCLASTATSCKICKSGASLDPKGFCQNFKDNNCEGSYVEFLSNNFVGEIDGISITNQAIFWANSKTNCAKCRSTFINISYQQDFPKCFASVERENIVYASNENSSARILESNQIEKLTHPPSFPVHQTSSILNCDSADVIDGAVCVVCQQGFLLHPDSRTCHQILNCSQQEYIFGTFLICITCRFEYEQIQLEM